MENHSSFPSSPVIRLPKTNYSRSTEIMPQGDYFDSHGEKKTAVDTIEPVESPYTDAEHSEQQPEKPQWDPGFFAQFPRLGAGALVVVVICAIAAVVTLLISNGKSERHWPQKLAPNVILSGLNSAANLCLSIAIGNGIAIAWWRQALKGATIEKLHKSWSFSNSVKDAALAGKYFNIIALAALSAKLTIVDNMLMQRAFSTEIASDPPRNVSSVNLWANDSIPVTGAVGGRSGAGMLLTTQFNIDTFGKSLMQSLVLFGLLSALQYRVFIKHWLTFSSMFSRRFLSKLGNIWLQLGGLVPAYGSGCDGICFLKVPAAGFEFDCTAPVTQSVDYGNETVTAAIIAGNGSSLDNTTLTTSATLFDLSFDAGSTDPYDLTTGNPNAYADGVTPDAYSYLTMNVTFSSAKDIGNSTQNIGCPGTVTTQSCTLRPAVVEYPVMIQNTSSSLSNISSTLSGQLLNGAMSFDTEQDYNGDEDDGKFDTFDLGNKQMDGFKVLKYNNISPLSGGTGLGYGTVPALGGILQAMKMYLGGNAVMTFDGIYGFQLNQTGNAQQYLTNGPTGEQCGFQYSDPVTPGDDWVLNSVMKSINQIMFTLATDVNYNSQTSDDLPPAGQDFNATIYRESVHYVTHQPYMWGAFASMLSCVLLVLPTYWGYWQLGRKVSLGPFEIAHAFRSPMTADVPNGTVDDIMSQVGQKQVKFGQIVAGDAKGVLGVAEPEYVERVHPNIGSAKAEINEKMGTVFGGSSKK